MPKLVRASHASVPCVDACDAAFVEGLGRLVDTTKDEFIERLYLSIPATIRGTDLLARGGGSRRLYLKSLLKVRGSFLFCNSYNLNELEKRSSASSVDTPTIWRSISRKFSSGSVSPQKPKTSLIQLLSSDSGCDIDEIVLDAPNDLEFLQDRDVVIKRMSSNESGSGEVEVNVLALCRRFRHPNLMHLNGIAGAGVSKLVILPSFRVLPPTLRLTQPLEQLRFLHDVSRALSFLHECSVLHLNVKPENLLVSLPHAESGIRRVVLGSFAECRFCNVPGSGKKIKVNVADTDGNGDDVNTLSRSQWRAPEMTRAPFEVSTAADIFSLGLVCATLFGEFDGVQRARRLSVANPQALLKGAKMPKRIKHMVSECLQMTPEARPEADTVARVCWPMLMDMAPTRRQMLACNELRDLMDDVEAQDKSSGDQDKPRPCAEANSKFLLHLGAIQDLAVDAIVSLPHKNLDTEFDLTRGKNSVGGAVLRAAGTSLVHDFRDRVSDYKVLNGGKQWGGLEPGDAFISPGYDLPSRFIIHVRGVTRAAQNDEKRALEQLRMAYRAVFDAAISHPDIHVLAVPLIGAGRGIVIVEQACEVAISEIRQFLDTTGKNKMTAVILVIFQKPDSRSFPERACCSQFTRYYFPASEKEGDTVNRPWNQSGEAEEEEEDSSDDPELPPLPKTPHDASQVAHVDSTVIAPTETSTSPTVESLERHLTWDTLSEQWRLLLSQAGIKRHHTQNTPLLTNLEKEVRRVAKFVIKDTASKTSSSIPLALTLAVAVTTTTLSSPNPNPDASSSDSDSDGYHPINGLDMALAKLNADNSQQDHSHWWQRLYSHVIVPSNPIRRILQRYAAQCRIIENCRIDRLDDAINAATHIIQTDAVAGSDDAAKLMETAEKIILEAKSQFAEGENLVYDFEKPKTLIKKLTEDLVV